MRRTGAYPSPVGVNNAAWVAFDNAMVLTGYDDPGIRVQIRDVLEQAAAAGQIPVRSPVVESQPPA